MIIGNAQDLMCIWMINEPERLYKGPNKTLVFNWGTRIYATCRIEYGYLVLGAVVNKFGGEWESHVCIWFAVWCVQLFVGIIRYLVEGDLIYCYIYGEKDRKYTRS